MNQAATIHAATGLLSNAPLGEVSQTGDALQVVFRRHYRFPVEKVWAALTVPERLADWLADATVDLRVGGTIGLNWNGEFQRDMTITVCEPPRALAWIWRLDDRDTLVRFDLAVAGEGCNLTLTHAGVPLTSGGVRRGWHAHLEALPEAIEGRRTAWAVKQAREAAIADAYPKLL